MRPPGCEAAELSHRGLVKEETHLISANQNKKSAFFITHYTTMRIKITQNLL